MNLELSGKTALLVGGGGTLGRACANVLREEGAVPVIADVKPDLGSSNDSLVIDVTQPASVKNAIAQFLDKYDRLDILITLAGIYQGGPVTGISPDDWRRVLDVNLTGTFLVCREALPVMQQQDFGRIICVASLAGQVGGVVAGANYSASKA